MDTINIEIRKPNRIKELLHNFHDRLEDTLFSIIQRLPERLIPHCLIEWMEQYLNKRIFQLQQETIKQNWKNIYLQKAVTEIHNKQQDAKEAPSDN
ncbi:hypothetical protein [Candidatus Merdisoma sp. JLR.KK006]|uniref:hypothetical protein n=1 Tax=Candidatus Merdisoma sp. JLR.KK006 TaxID=3112626 RepID=UPI002FF214EA